MQDLYDLDVASAATAAGQLNPPVQQTPLELETERIHALAKDIHVTRELISQKIDRYAGPENQAAPGDEACDKSVNSSGQLGLLGSAVRNSEEALSVLKATLSRLDGVL